MDDVAGFDILVQMFGQVDILLLIFVRILGFFMVVPIISSQNIWMMARLFLALVMAIALFSSGVVTTVYYAGGTPSYIYMILLEFMVGMAMGYVSFAVFNLIFFAGQLIDFQIGLMMVNVLDPMTQIQVPLVGNLLYFALMALVVANGGIHMFFQAFFYSYTILDIGSAVVIGNVNLAWYMLFILVESTILAVRISMPIVGTMMIINIALGIMVKTVPQMNIFVVGLPLKLLVGIVLIWLVMIPALGGMYNQMFDMAINDMREVIWGMRPS